MSATLSPSLRMAWRFTKGSLIKKCQLLKIWGSDLLNHLSLFLPLETRTEWNRVTTVIWTCPLLTFAKMMNILKLMKYLKHPLSVVVVVGPLNAAPATLKWWNPGSRFWTWSLIKQNGSISSDLKANYGRGSRSVISFVTNNNVTVFSHVTIIKYYYYYYYYYRHFSHFLANISGAKHLLVLMITPFACLD